MKRLFARGHFKGSGTRTRSISVTLSILMFAGLLVSLPQAPVAAEGSHEMAESIPPPPGPGDNERKPHVPKVKSAGLNNGHHEGPVGGPGGRKVVEGLQEVPGLRTRLGRGFETEDGDTHVAQMLTSPVNYVDQDGSLKPIDLSLHSVAGGYESGANSFQLFFPEQYTPGRGVEITYAAGTIATKLEGANPTGAVPGEGTIDYPSLLPHVKAHYALTVDGYKENLLLDSPQAPPSFTYILRTELDVERTSDGGLLIRDEGQPVSLVPAPVVFDASDQVADVSTGLAQSSPDVYRYTITVPRSWLDDPARTFPVTVDPTQVDVKCYPENASVTCTNDVGLPLLKDLGIMSDNSFLNWYLDRLGAGVDANSREGRSFLTFDVRQQVRKVGDLIYSAKFDIYSEGFVGTTQDYRLYRISAPWADPQLGQAAPNWASQPAIDTSAPYVTHNGCPEAPATLCTDPGWLRWNVKDVVQYWIDHGVNSNHGFRLSNNTGGAKGIRRFYSGNVAAPNTDKRPYMVVVANALPGTRQFDMNDSGWPWVEYADSAIPDGATIETDTPTLAIKDLTDINDDPIRVRFQVSTSAQNWNANNLAYDSKWIKETDEVTVPEGSLYGGGTYFWRVLTGDVCSGSMAVYLDPDTEENEAGLCDDKGQRPTSSVRSFTVGAKRRGHDPRWSMWRTALGNGMDLRVDHASGNLLLEYPVDSLATPVGPLDIDIAYNSQAAAGKDVDTTPGLPDGWELSIGPGANPNHLPVRLKELPYGQGVAVTLRSGRRDVYVKTSPGRYATVGTGAGVIQRRGDAWLLTTSSGGTFRFLADGSLKAARVSTSSASQQGFSYNVDSSKRFTTVSDPLSRTVTFDYANAGGLLSKITTWDGRSWNLGVANGEFTTITDPNGDTIELHFGDDKKLDAVIDGEAHTATGTKPETAITYLTVNDRPRVQSVEPAGLGEYRFDYSFPTNGSPLIALTSSVTDPRGVETTGTGDDFKKILDFNGAGLPVMIRGPQTQAGWPVSRFGWDLRGNLDCKRSPAANAINDVPCEPSPLPGHDYKPGFDGLQTEYVYQARAPYLLEKRVNPAASSGALGARLVTRFGYDETYNSSGTPTPFSGVQVHYFDNADLIGLPKDTGIVQGLQPSWGTGSPTGLPTVFSARYFGEIVPTNTEDQEKPYEFKLQAGNGALLAVGKKIVIDCFSATSCDQTGTVDLLPNRASFLLEYAHRSGNAGFNLQWKPPGATSFQAIPATKLMPNTDAPTLREVKRADAAPSSTPISKTVYTYPTDSDKQRRLVTKETLDGERMSVPQSVDYEYDTFGRVKKETDGTGKAITHTYLDPSSNFSSVGVCEQETIDRALLSVQRQCDAAGDVLSESVGVSGILTATGNTDSENRVTTYTYDGVGRMLTTTLPDDGQTTFTYDDAGRLLTESHKVSQSASRVTSFTYLDSGLIETETLPDPEGDANDMPTVHHAYDDTGNETTTTDVMGNDWTFTYDAANALLSERDPAAGTIPDPNDPGSQIENPNDRTEYVYDVAGRMTEKTLPSPTSTRPVVHKRYDVLGRVTERWLAGLAKTTMEYEPRGLLKKRSGPDQGMYVSYEYDAAGRIRFERRPVGDNGAEKTKTFVYDSSGRLESETDFIGSAVTGYSYDDAGHLKKVTLPHSAPNETIYHLNSAGEVEKTEIPRDNGDPITSEFDYDKMGRVLRERDGLDHRTTYTYDLSGAQLTSTDPRGYLVKSTFDHAGRQERREVSLGGTVEEAIDFTYDKAGRMKTADDGTDDVGMDYDEAGQLIDVTGVAGSTSYAYVSNRVTSIDDSAGHTDIGYDLSTGRVSSIIDPVTGGTSTFSSYKPSGRLAERTNPSGAVHTYAYDTAGRRSSEGVTKSGAHVATFTQEYDANGQVTLRTSNVATGLDNGSWEFGYDGAGRLTSATDPDGDDFVYAYDPAGNRTFVSEEETVGGVTDTTTVTTTYDTASRPTTATVGVTHGQPPGTSTTTYYDHDEAGNLTEIDDGNTVWNYSYDGLSRLERVEQSIAGLPQPVVEDLSYDPLDRNLTSSKTVRTPVGDVSLIETSHKYRGLDETLARTDESLTILSDATAIASKYASGPMGMIAQGITTTPSGGAPSLVTSVLGSGPHSDVNYTLSTAGVITGTKSYDPWGGVRTENGIGSDLGFQSDPTSSESGLVDMGARHYLPDLGRFLTEDPARDGTNYYAYAGNDPVSMWDPTGLLRDDAQGVSDGETPAERRRERNADDPIVPVPITNLEESTIQAQESAWGQIQAIVEVGPWKTAVYAGILPPPGPGQGTNWIAIGFLAVMAAPVAVALGTAAITAWGAGEGAAAAGTLIVGSGAATTVGESAEGAAVTTEVASEAVTGYSSSALRANMEAVGEYGKGLQAHHIVPGGSYGGNANLAAARATLERFGVGLDEAANGTYLPSGWHQSVHTLDYFQSLNDALGGVGSRSDVVGVLRTFASQLQNNLTFSPRTGNLPW